MLSYTNFWKKLYLTALGVFLLEEILRHSCYTAFTTTDLLCKALLVFSCSVVLLKLSVSFFQGKIPLLELSVMATLAAYCLFLVLQNRSGVFFFLILFSAGGFDVDFEQIVQVFLVSLTASILLIFLSCYTGIIGETCLYRDLDGKLLQRWSLGFHYYYEASHYVFFLILIWIYCRKNRISWIELSLLFLLSWLVYSGTNTKSPFYLSSAAILLDALNKLVPTPHRYKKIHAIIAVCIYPLCCLSLVLFTKYADSQGNLWQSANELVTGRLALNLKAYQTYGYNLFGNTITWSTGSDYTLVDSSYLMCLFEYGFFFLLTLMAVWILLGYFSNLRKDSWYAFVSVFIALYSIFDNFLLRPECNVFLLASPYINTAFRGLHTIKLEGDGLVKKIYFKYVLLDLWEHRYVSILIIILSVIGSLYYGFNHYEQTIINKQEKQLQSTEHYLNLLNSYEQDVIEARGLCDEQKAATESLKDIEKNSTLMLIDPNHVQEVSLRYSIVYTEGANASAIVQALLDYLWGESIRSGIKNAEELDGVGGQGMLRSSIYQGILTITLLHYDMKKADYIMQELKMRVESQVPYISGLYGTFSLSSGKISHYETADLELMNTINEYLTSLSQSLVSETERNNTLISKEVSLDSFTKNNAEMLSVASANSPAIPLKTYLFEFALFGLIIGIGVCGTIGFWKNIYSDIINKHEELNGTPYQAVALIKDNEYKPSVEMAALNIALLKRNIGNGVLFIQDLSKNLVMDESINCLFSIIERNGIRIYQANQIPPREQDIQQLIKADCCLFIVKAGTTKVSEMREEMAFFQRYQVQLIGSIVTE